MGIKGPVSEIITIIRSILIGWKGSPQRGIWQRASRKPPAPRRSEHKIWKRSTILITCRIWSSLCHGCTCVGVHKVCCFLFCVCLRVHNYVCVCIYRTGELISADKALQAFLVPAVPAAAIIHLMEYNAFITARISQRTSQFINQRCVYTAPNNTQDSCSCR